VGEVGKLGTSYDRGFVRMTRIRYRQLLVLGAGSSLREGWLVRCAGLRDLDL